jgi:hypothetical protein
MPLPAPGDGLIALASQGRAKSGPAIKHIHTVNSTMELTEGQPLVPRQATVASELVRTGWLTEIALEGPQALQDVENLGYSAHLPYDKGRRFAQLALYLQKFLMLTLS